MVSTKNLIKCKICKKWKNKNLYKDIFKIISGKKLKYRNKKCIYCLTSKNNYYKYEDIIKRNVHKIIICI